MPQRLRALKVLLDDLARDSSLIPKFETLTVAELRAILDEMGIPGANESENPAGATGDGGMSTSPAGKNLRIGGRY